MRKLIAPTLLIAGLLALATAIATVSSASTAAPAAAPAKILLTPANTVVFRGAVDGASVIKASLKLTALAIKRGKANYPIYLVMDSPGGSIAAGDNFIAYAKTIPNVETISLFAASMAAGIVESLPGRRHVTENGILMFHRARGTIEGQFEDGEMEKQLEFYKAIVRTMEQRNADRIGITLADYKAKVKDEWWIYGKSNIDQKTADNMAEVSCSKELTDERETIVGRIFIFAFKAEYSGCPLLRSAIPSSKPDKDEEEEE